MKFQSPFSLLIVLGTILFSAFVFLMTGQGWVGGILVMLLIVAGVYFATEDETEKVDRKHFVKNLNRENLSKTPPLTGEYWKMKPVTQKIVEQIFDDLEFPYAWMLVGEGSLLARKRMGWDDDSNFTNHENYIKGHNKMMQEIAYELDFDSALEQFLIYAKNYPQEKYFPYEFSELFNRIVQRDLEKSFSALEKFLEVAGNMDKEHLCAIIGRIEFPEWNKTAGEICKREKPEYYRENDMNEDIAEYFGGEIKYFEMVEKNIPENNLMLKRYHAMIRKVNCGV